MDHVIGHDTPPIPITTDYHSLSTRPNSECNCSGEGGRHWDLGLRGASDDHLSASAMQMKEAWAVLGLPCNATPLQVKIAYKRKALENHPDRFPAHVKLEAEARFKHISEAYTCLKNGPQATYGYGGRSQYSNYSGSSSWVNRGRRVHVFVASAPFALLIAGTLALGFSRAARAYRIQQKESPARNPFLP